MQITENSTVRFREWDPRAGIIATVQKVNFDSFGEVQSLNVRILRGQDGAGQIVSTFPEHVEEFMNADEENFSREVPPYDLPDLHSTVTVSPIDSIKEWIRCRTPIDWIGILGWLILLFIILTNLTGKSEMTRSVEKLNQINLKDSKDLEIKREAESRIAERRDRKKELLKQIKFE